MSTLYKHPDGYSIDYCGGKLVGNDGIDSVLIPIGPDGLRELATKLNRLAEKLSHMEYEAMLNDLIGGDES